MVKPTTARLLFLAALLLSVCLPLGAHAPVSEKPHLGLEARETPSHRGFALANSLNEPGLAESLRQHRVRSRCSAKERDAESGLDYFGARYFGSSLGRFLSPDGPFFDQHQGNPQSWNLYTYVRNAPTNFTDPSGTTCVVNADGSEETVDDSGETCEGIAVDNVLGGAEATVVAAPGPAVNAFFINAFFGVNNLANDSFAFLFDQRPQSLTNIPLSRGLTGRSAGGLVFAGAFVGNPKTFVQTVSRSIGRGHAFTKHVLTKGDLGGLIIGIGGQVKQIRTVDDLAQLVGHIITKAKGGDVKNLSRGRKAWWDSETGTVVIHDPDHPDLGTVFRPDDGRAFFDRLN